MEHILENFESEIQVYLKKLNLELSDVEYIQDGGYNYLRVYVEKTDGSTSLDDCVALSTEIDEIADKLIKEKFFLEVSTPGIERKLKKVKDFLRFTGKKIKVYTKSQVEGKKTFQGKLEKFEDDIIYIMDEKLGKIIGIPLNKLKKSNLIYEMPNDMLDSKEE